MNHTRHTRHTEIHHRTEVARTTVRHYDSTGIFERSERVTHDTLEDAMMYAYVVADDADHPVAFFIDGVEFAITAGGAK